MKILLWVLVGGSIYVLGALLVFGWQVWQIRGDDYLRHNEKVARTRNHFWESIYWPALAPMVVSFGIFVLAEWCTRRIRALYTAVINPALDERVFGWVAKKLATRPPKTEVVAKETAASTTT